jgi:fermentation-respiration switch protein FrsA (DUF1100 family)
VPDEGSLSRVLPTLRSRCSHSCPIASSSSHTHRVIGFQISQRPVASAYDYRGYWTSRGVSSEKSLYEDVDAAYEYVTRTLQVSPDQIISFGRSLGCAVAGLIVEAPFLSAFRVLTHVRLLPWEKFDNAAKIPRVHCPVLVIHGRSDRVVPWWHGERIYELANEPKRYLWVDRAGHNDVLPFASRRYFAAINDFAGLLDSRCRP